MPPRTRTRATKVLKENIENVKTSKHKSNGVAKKQQRKALADKTNSLSSDNDSIDIPVKTKNIKLKSFAAKAKHDGSDRPKRERRLPSRYVESQVLKNLSNGTDSPVKQGISTAVSTELQSFPVSSRILLDGIIDNKTDKSVTTSTDMKKNIRNLKESKKAKDLSSKLKQPRKNEDTLASLEDSMLDGKKVALTRSTRNSYLQTAVDKPANNRQNFSPFKTSDKLESSLVANRPKRICRLPSKFEEHSISPSKFIPVQPSHASTPIQHKNKKPIIKVTNDNFNKGHTKASKIKSPENLLSQKSILPKKNAKTDLSYSSDDKSSPDTNNNGNKKTLRVRQPIVSTKLQTKQVSPKGNKIAPFSKKLLDHSLSFRVLENKKTTKEKENLDVYEFTFDPNEEPLPQKKKRKRTVNKKPTKPKTIILKCNYNDNVSKALASLKSKVKPSQPVQNNVKCTENIVQSKTIEKVQSTQTKPVSKDMPQCNNYSANITPAMIPLNDSVKSSIHESNYASIRVEDIAADFEFSDHHDINYSPVNSPHRPVTPDILESIETQKPAEHNNDPLNLQGDLSFFDDHPVASSSMNVSVRHPQASPWRVEFGNLPVKWQSNTYVKPNMTPSVESSFICSEEMKRKKHVYTNMLAENEPLPEIVESVPNLKQPSIISFMKEVAERSALKRKRRSSPSPKKANSIFEDIVDTSNDLGYKLPKKAKKTNDSTPNVSGDSNNRSNDKENSNNSSKKSISPDKPEKKKDLQKKKDKNCTYFGFDDSENVDQENLSPVKIIPKTWTRGLRSRTVLQDFNAQIAQAGPTRAVMPVALKAKLTSSEVADQLYDQLKSTEDAQFPEKETATEPVDNTVTTNIDDPTWHEDNDDSQSVHLFEDIDVVHYLKPHRKSYGKAKKVTFQQRSDSDSDSQMPDAVDPAHSSDDDLADLSFHIPNVKQKKVTKKKKPKKLLSKKEEKEVEEWAAGFNSMCEDIDEFPLLVE